MAQERSLASLPRNCRQALQERLQQRFNREFQARTTPLAPGASREGGVDTVRIAPARSLKHPFVSGTAACIRRAGPLWVGIGQRHRTEKRTFPGSGGMAECRVSGARQMTASVAKRTMRVLPQRQGGVHGEIALGFPNLQGEVGTVAGAVAASSPRKGCTASCELRETWSSAWRPILSPSH